MKSRVLVLASALVALEGCQSAASVRGAAHETQSERSDLLIDLFVENFWVADTRIIVTFLRGARFGRVESSGARRTSRLLSRAEVANLRSLAGEELMYLGTNPQVCDDSSMVYGLVRVGIRTHSFQVEDCPEPLPPAVVRVLELAGVSARSANHSLRRTRPLPHSVWAAVVGRAGELRIR